MRQYHILLYPHFRLVKKKKKKRKRKKKKKKKKKNAGTFPLTLKQNSILLIIEEVFSFFIIARYCFVSFCGFYLFVEDISDHF